MGGHGGLNILPQKRWNVYNRDNKEKVERDQKKHLEKKEEVDKNLYEGQASSRYDFLKRKNNNRDKKNESNGQGKSHLNKELEEMTKSKHMNLFQDEEKINAIEANRNAKLEKEKKNLPYDESSKFLGVLDEKQNKPWYINVNGAGDQNKKKIIHREKVTEKDRDFYKAMKDFQMDSKTYFKVIDEKLIRFDKKQQISQKKECEINEEIEITKERSESNDKKEKKHKENKDKEIKDKKHKHHQKNKKDSRSRSRSKEKGDDHRNKHEKLAKLREERLKREQNEKKKVLELLNKIYD